MRRPAWYRLCTLIGMLALTAAREQGGRMAFSLSSVAFKEGAAIPIRHTCDGADVSPPLGWSGAPPGTAAFALIADDPDAPAGTWVHWVLYDLPAVRALFVASVVTGMTLGAATPAPPFSVIVLPPGLRGMMSAVWIQNNRHWDELAGQNTLTQLLGTGRPTQREYLGCLAGEVANDTMWVRELESAADLKQLQFAVAGNCDQVDHLVGTWHTNPSRA